jgi:hypothetical protein
VLNHKNDICARKGKEDIGSVDMLSDEEDCTRKDYQLDREQKQEVHSEREIHMNMSIH